MQTNYYALVPKSPAPQNKILGCRHCGEVRGQDARVGCGFRSDLGGRMSKPDPSQLLKAESGIARQFLP